MPYPHTPHAATLFWMLAAVPFTLWDTAYLLLRPHTLPGHEWNMPLWQPYIAYAAVDRVYSEQAWEEKNGFAAAQGVMNLVEAAGYVVYLWLVFRGGAAGRRQGGADPRWRRAMGGKEGAAAVVVGLGVGAMTVGKTVIYVLNEAFSGWHYLGHNDWRTLLQYWGVMVCLYLGFSVHMTYVFGRDIMAGLTMVGEEQGENAKRKE